MSNRPLDLVVQFTSGPARSRRSDYLRTRQICPTQVWLGDLAPTRADGLELLWRQGSGLQQGGVLPPAAGLGCADDRGMDAGDTQGEPERRGAAAVGVGLEEVVASFWSRSQYGWM